MKNRLTLFGFVFAAQMEAAPLPPAAPIVSATELRAAATNAPVARIDFLIPKEKATVETALAERFFNRPEEHLYSGLTDADWEGKWRLFSDSLVEKAKSGGLDSTSLEACLRALNRGRNRQTMLEPMRPNEDLLVGGRITKEMIEEQKREQEKQRREYDEAVRRRDEHPEEFNNDSLAVVPVAAYLGRYVAGECWIVVCKWEKNSKNGSSRLGHIMIWAMDTKTATVVAYVSCD